MQMMNPNVALKEFIALNKKFCEFLKSINKMLSNNEVAKAFSQVSIINSYTESMEKIKKFLPEKLELEKSSLFNDLVLNQKDLKELMEETEILLKAHIQMNEKVTQFLASQASEIIKENSGYSINGTIAYSSNHLQYFAISNKV